MSIDISAVSGIGFSYDYLESKFPNVIEEIKLELHRRGRNSVLIEDIVEQICKSTPTQHSVMSYIYFNDEYDQPYEYYIVISGSNYNEIKANEVMFIAQLRSKGFMVSQNELSLISGVLYC